jgi:hypothetical protein
MHVSLLSDSSTRDGSILTGYGEPGKASSDIADTRDDVTPSCGRLACASDGSAGLDEIKRVICQIDSGCLSAVAER